MIINLTSAAVIIWSGMLVIAGSVLILSSQVRHLVDLLQSRDGAAASSRSDDGRQAVRAVMTAAGSRRVRNSGPRNGLPSSRRATTPVRDPA